MPETTAPSLTTITQFSFLFTALVTVAGWFIAAKQADFRELRKEVREHTKFVSERCQKVRESASKYWLGPSDSEAANAIALKADVMSLSRQVHTLGLLGINVAPELMAEVRTSATGGNFEEKGRIRTSADENRILDVTNAIEDLLMSIDNIFYTQFPVSKKSGFAKFLPLGALTFLSADRGSEI